MVVVSCRAATLCSGRRDCPHRSFKATQTRGLPGNFLVESVLIVSFYVIAPESRQKVKQHGSKS